MEPLKALTLVAMAGVVSLAGASAAGFYAGYSAGRSSTDQIKTQLASLALPATVTSSSGTPANISLKPVLEDIRALSKQVEAINARQSEALSAGNRSGAVPAIDTSAISKPITDEIRSLTRQIESLRASGGGNGASQPQAASSTPAMSMPDYRDSFDTVSDQFKALNAKIDKQEPRAPKVLLDEIRSLSAMVQAQEPYARRVMTEEIRGAVATLQNAEHKPSKALLDEIKGMSASLKSQESRLQAQAAVLDQIRSLNQAVEALRVKMPDSMGEDLKRVSVQISALGDRTANGSNADRSKTEANLVTEMGQLRQLVSNASDQFGKCQTQLASLSTASLTPQPVSATSAAVKQEAGGVVFYDNVMLRKDQEKQYEEIGVRLSLQSVAPRQVRVAINRQGIGLAFGERKVFRSQDVECELNLMETNLSDAQARVSISCKR